MTNRFASVLVILMLNLPLLVAAQGVEFYTVSLPQGNLREALVALGKQTQVSLIFAEETVEGMTVDAVVGKFSFQQLLSELLGNHCLRYEYVRDELVALSPGCDPPLDAVAEPLERQAIEALPQPRNGTIEELLVRERPPTGSRLRNANFNQTMPLDVIDQTEIRLSGLQSVAELLRYVPAVSGNSTSTLVSNGGDGSATITLRGLPSSNTLVLLNGKRMNSDALLGRSVDLNTLPLSMVEQIEILKDGASAIYGSDAIAGVVNIITKTNVEGLSVNAYAGRAAQGDLQTQNFSVTGGLNPGPISIVYGLSYYDQQGIYSRDRSLSSSSDDRSRGGIDKRSSATVPARVSLPDGMVILSDGLDGTDPSHFRDATAEDRFEYRDFTSSIVPSRRLSAFAQGIWQVSAESELFAEVLYTSTETDIFLAPVPLFTGFETSPLVIAADQLHNPFDIELTDVRRRFVELGPRRQTNSSDTYRMVLSYNYYTEAMNLEVALQLNRTDAEQAFVNTISQSRTAQAISANCNAPCVPLNLFGRSGTITPQMLDFIAVNSKIDGKSTLSGIMINADWRVAEWSAGTVSVSAGLEYRNERLRIEPDAAITNADLIGGVSRAAVVGARDIVETYAEIYLPLIKDRRWVRMLDAQVAVRFSRYSDFGYEINPRLVISYVPTAGTTIRMSTSFGFRAPTLLQLFSGEILSFEQWNDPCSIAQNVNVLVGCTQQSDATLTQFLTATGGNPQLDPERSRSLSIGILRTHQWRHSTAEVSVDWFHIRQRDVVDSAAQLFINNNAQNGTFADRISRDSNGNITRIQANLLNVGSRNVAGFDFSASWKRQMGTLGTLTIAVDATHIASFKDKFSSNSPSEEKAGTFSDEASGGMGALPDWKSNLSIAWQQEFWQVHYHIHHVSDLQETIPLLGTDRTIGSWRSHNANLSYLGPRTQWFRLTFGVNNLLDDTPPFSAAAFNDSYDARTYDITGRYFFLKVDKSF